MNKKDRFIKSKENSIETLQLINAISRDSLAKEFRETNFTGIHKNCLGKKTFSKQRQLDSKSCAKQALIIQLINKYGCNCEIAKAGINAAM